MPLNKGYTKTGTRPKRLARRAGIDLCTMIKAIFTISLAVRIAGGYSPSLKHSASAFSQCCPPRRADEGRGFVRGVRT